jgi:hypothetical protein
VQALLPHMIKAKKGQIVNTNRLRVTCDDYGFADGLLIFFLQRGREDGITLFFWIRGFQARAAGAGDV